MSNIDRYAKFISEQARIARLDGPKQLSEAWETHKEFPSGDYYCPFTGHNIRHLLIDPKTGNKALVSRPEMSEEGPNKIHSVQIEFGPNTPQTPEEHKRLQTTAIAHVAPDYKHEGFKPHPPHVMTARPGYTGGPAAGIGGHYLQFPLPKNIVDTKKLSEEWTAQSDGTLLHRDGHVAVVKDGQVDLKIKDEAKMVDNLTNQGTINAFNKLHPPGHPLRNVTGYSKWLRATHEDPEIERLKATALETATAPENKSR